MDPDATDPPTLTAKDVAKVEALIDPNPLPCGGRGLIEAMPNGKPVDRTQRWSFGRKSTAAVARLHLGYGWREGILRRRCPVAPDRCLTHRFDDPDALSPSDDTSPGPLSPNAVPHDSDRASTAPGGNGPESEGRADSGPLRQAQWATMAAAADQGGHHHSSAEHGAPAPPPPAPPAEVAPAPGTSRPLGGTDPQPPERGLGVEDTRGTAGALVPTPPPRRDRRRLRLRPPSRASWGRVARTLAAVATALALIFALYRCGHAVSLLDPPDTRGRVPGGGPTTTPAPPTPTDPAATTPPTAPPETTAPPPSSIGPIFPVCPPSWETTTAPIEGC